VFEERIKSMIPDAEKLFSASTEWKSIRVNTLKIGRDELLERLSEKFEVREMPWYENGFFIKGDITKSLEYYLGYYHVQEAGSMLPPLVMLPDKNDCIIDICAAPGSKTTQMAMMMENEGIIFANDVNSKRLRALAHNIQKCGVVNCIILNHDGRFLWKKGIRGDKILLDAPCTASGKIIKNKNMTWSYGRVIRMSKLQKRLIESASKCLIDGGTLVYSTCSLEPEENEEVIDYAIKNLNMEAEKIELVGIKTRRGIKRWGDKEYEGAEKAIRIWPQDNLTEGFFICKLRKY